MVLPRVVDHLAREEHPEDPDLLAVALRAVREVLAQSDELDLVPAETDAQARAAVREHVE